MATSLRWRDAARPDRTVLQWFTCTVPRVKRRTGGWRIEHPALWELDVQSKIRHRVHPPVSLPDRCLLGFDGEELAAVVYFEELDGPAQVIIHAIAVSLDRRRQGGRLADETLAVALDHVVERALGHGVSHCQILAQIHRRNRPSQELFRRTGFSESHLHADDGDLRTWQAVLFPQPAEPVEQ